MSDIYTKIVQEYQKEIKDYCFSRLKNIQAAEDCTQEVFFVLFKKMKLLNLSVNIQGWLYKTAEREVKAYLRKNPQLLNIDEIPEQHDESADLGKMNILDELDPDERTLIADYYSGEDKAAVAEKYGITTGALYIKVFRIKTKLKQLLNNSNK